MRTDFRAQAPPIKHCKIYMHPSRLLLLWIWLGLLCKAKVRVDSCCAGRCPLCISNWKSTSVSYHSRRTAGSGKPWGPRKQGEGVHPPTPHTRTESQQLADASVRAVLQEDAEVYSTDLMCVAIARPILIPAFTAVRRLDWPQVR